MCALTTNGPTWTKWCPSCVRRGRTNSQLYIRSEETRWYGATISVQMYVDAPAPYYEEIVDTEVEPTDTDAHTTSLTCERECTQDQINKALQEQLDYEVLLNSVAAGV